MDYRKKEEDILEEAENKRYKISFKKRRTKSNIRLGAKLLVYLIIAAMSGAFFSNIMLDFKYGKTIRKVQDLVNNEGIINDYTKVIDIVAPSIVTISDSVERLTNENSNESNTTGIIIDDEGSILSNYSTIKELEKIYVKLSSIGSKIFEAKILVKSEESDLAIISIESEEKLKPVKFAETNTLRVGQNIAIIGNVRGTNDIDSITPGIITAKDNSGSVGERNKALIQVSAPINKNNTGGPICNLKGEVIGLASSKLSEEFKESGLYYGLKVKGLEVILNSSNAFKSILGVSEGGILSDVDNEFKGFYVQEVDKKGNAYNAGIKPTDIILEIDNNKVISIEEATEILNDKQVGELLKCKVLRDGDVIEIEVKIEK